MAFNTNDMFKMIDKYDIGNYAFESFYNSILNISGIESLNSITGAFMVVELLQIPDYLKQQLEARKTQIDIVLNAIKNYNGESKLILESFQTDKFKCLKPTDFELAHQSCFKLLTNYEHLVKFTVNLFNEFNKKDVAKNLPLIKNDFVEYVEINFNKLNFVEIVVTDLSFDIKNNNFPDKEYIVKNLPELREYVLTSLRLYESHETLFKNIHEDLKFIITQHRVRQQTIELFETLTNLSQETKNTIIEESNLVYQICVCLINMYQLLNEYMKYISYPVKLINEESSIQDKLNDQENNSEEKDNVPVIHYLAKKGFKLNNENM